MTPIALYGGAALAAADYWFAARCIAALVVGILWLHLLVNE